MEILKCNVLAVTKIVKESDIKIVDHEMPFSNTSQNHAILTDCIDGRLPFNAQIKEFQDLLDDLKDKDSIIYEYTSTTQIIVSKKVRSRPLDNNF